MGMRMKKSINLGGGFRINVSKSGVGYSWGTKGYRVTHKAGGGKRKTVSVPGTGLSYVEETSSPRQKQRKQQVQSVVTPNTYDIEDLKNANAQNISSEGIEDMLLAANKVLSIYSKLKIGLIVSIIIGLAYKWVFIISLGCAIAMYRVRKTKTIYLEYSFEGDEEENFQKRMTVLRQIVKSKNLWWITQTSKVADRKYTGGAGHLIKKNNCNGIIGVQFPFTSNCNGVSFKMKKEAVMFMPDKVFVIQGNKVGALNYSDVNLNFGKTQFIEEEKVPADATVIGYTWKYVNKSGGPDKRFQNNKQLPICLYGELSVNSTKGLNTVIMFSDSTVLDSE